MLTRDRPRDDGNFTNFSNIWSRCWTSRNTKCSRFPSFIIFSSFTLSAPTPNSHANDVTGWVHYSCKGSPGQTSHPCKERASAAEVCGCSWKRLIRRGGKRRRENYFHNNNSSIVTKNLYSWTKVICSAQKWWLVSTLHVTINSFIVLKEWEFFYKFSHPDKWGQGTCHSLVAFCCFGRLPFTHVRTHKHTQLLPVNSFLICIFSFPLQGQCSSFSFSFLSASTREWVLRATSNDSFFYSFIKHHPEVSRFSLAEWKVLVRCCRECWESFSA